MNDKTALKKAEKRNFLKILWVSLVLIALGELVMVILSFFRLVAKKEVAGSVARMIDAGSADTYEPGSVSAFVTGQFYLVCLEDDGFLALFNRCTHLGCAVPWNKESKKFICPCHASEYDITSNVLNSPAPERWTFLRSAS